MSLTRTAALAGLLCLLVVGVSAAAPALPARTSIQVCVEVTGSAETRQDLKLRRLRDARRGRGS